MDGPAAGLLCTFTFTPNLVPDARNLSVALVKWSFLAPLTALDDRRIRCRRVRAGAQLYINKILLLLQDLADGPAADLQLHHYISFSVGEQYRRTRFTWSTYNYLFIVLITPAYHMCNSTTPLVINRSSLVTRFPERPPGRI